MSKDRYRPSTADFEVTRTRPKQVDARLSIPISGYEPGAGTEDGVDFDLGDPFQDIEDEIIEDDWYPKNLRITSQTVRYNEQGRMMVDVAFAWDLLSGAEGYFLRITPADEPLGET